MDSYNNNNMRYFEYNTHLLGTYISYSTHPITVKVPQFWGPISPPTLYGSPDNLLIHKRIPTSDHAILLHEVAPLIIRDIRFRNQIVPTCSRFRMQMYSDSCYTSLLYAYQKPCYFKHRQNR